MYRGDLYLCTFDTGKLDELLRPLSLALLNITIAIPSARGTLLKLIPPCPRSLTAYSVKHSVEDSQSQFHRNRVHLKLRRTVHSIILGALPEQWLVL